MVFDGHNVTLAFPAMFTPPMLPLESGRMMKVTPVPPFVELHVHVGQLNVVLLGMSMAKPLLFPCPLPCPFVGPSTPPMK